MAFIFFKYSKANLSATIKYILMGLLFYFSSLAFFKTTSLCVHKQMYSYDIHTTHMYLNIPDLLLSSSVLEVKVVCTIELTVKGQFG